jgi:predicted TIM-barrel fold metal-dependent hydrolase
VRQGLRILDADAHVIEPGGLFAEWAPPGTSLLNLPPTTPLVPCGDFDLLTDQFQNGFDAPSYLRAMDAQGIDAVVLYPSMGLFVPFSKTLSAAESAEACRAYNRWIAEYCDHESSRMAGVGIVPLADVALAVAVAGQAAELGLSGVMVRPNQLYGRNLGDAGYDPLYDVLAGHELILAVHEGLGVQAPTIGDRFTTFTERHACSHPMEQMAAFLSLFVGGAFERHPDLRVAFLESGTGWLPYWLHRLDEHREWTEDTECAGLSCSATEYFARQCIISTDPDDSLYASVIAQVGSDHVVWASDFPHPDALFPNAVDSFLSEAATQLPPELLAHVMWDTPVSFYRLGSRFGSASTTVKAG